MGLVGLWDWWIYVIGGYMVFILTMGKNVRGKLSAKSRVPHFIQFVVKCAGSDVPNTGGKVSGQTRPYSKPPGFGR